MLASHFEPDGPVVLEHPLQVHRVIALRRAPYRRKAQQPGEQVGEAVYLLIRGALVREQLPNLGLAQRARRWQEAGA